MWYGWEKPVVTDKEVNPTEYHANKMLIPTHTLKHLQISMVLTISYIPYVYFTLWLASYSNVLSICANNVNPEN